MTFPFPLQFIYGGLRLIFNFQFSTHAHTFILILSPSSLPFVLFSPLFPKQAELEAYNNIDERWRFCLKNGASLTIERNMSMNQDEKGIVGPLEAPCSVLAVDVTRAVKGGGRKQRTLR